jgi:hypothetical protein
VCDSSRARGLPKIKGLTPPEPPDPNSIDGAIFRMAKRRRLREIVSMLGAAAVVTALVMTFYSILVS